MILVHKSIHVIEQTRYQLTALDASSGVEKATNPDPLLIPLGSRITYTRKHVCENVTQQIMRDGRLATQNSKAAYLTRRDCTKWRKQLLKFLITYAII